MRLRRFPAIRQRNEERAFKAVRTYSCSGRTAVVVFLFVFLLARLVGQYRGALSTLKEGSTVGVSLISEKYNDIVNAYHTAVDPVAHGRPAIPHEAKSEGANSRPMKRMPITRINPADEDHEPGPDAVAPAAKPSMIAGNGRKDNVKSDNVLAAEAATTNPGKVNPVPEKATAAIPVTESAAAAKPAAGKVGESESAIQHSEAADHALENATVSNGPPDNVAQKADNAAPIESVRKNDESTTKPKVESSNPEAQAHTPPGNVVENKPSKEQKPVKTLAEHLKFSQKTAINYMHFHKTGGVSFKTALFKFFLGKKKRNGEEVGLRDACYMRKVQATGSVPTFDRWRCDWAPVWEMTETERNKLDVVFGHQYWVNGAEAFLNQRDMRTFTVIRHPFDRKVSFFFHFFVRERNRDETKVEFDEVRDFLLYNKIRDKSLELGKDLGPNYMAGRLLSDGFEGYVGNAFHSYYDVKPKQKLEIAERALKIMRKYMFIGLQSESAAAKCMLRKTVDVFNAAHGINNPMTEDVARTAKVLNTGAYSLTASKIWERFSLEERILFDRKERVDLTIYQESERLFKQQVRLFKCGHLVKRRQLLD